MDLIYPSRLNNLNYTVLDVGVAQSSHSFGCVVVVGITVVNTVFGLVVGTVCWGHSVHNTVLEHSVLDDLGAAGPSCPRPSRLCPGTLKLRNLGCKQRSDRSWRHGPTVRRPPTP